jgi:hypothetical protein
VARSDEQRHKSKQVLLYRPAGSNRSLKKKSEQNFHSDLKMMTSINAETALNSMEQSPS